MVRFAQKGLELEETKNLKKGGGGLFVLQEHNTGDYHFFYEINLYANQKAMYTNTSDMHISLIYVMLHEMSLYEFKLI